MWHYNNIAVTLFLEFFLFKIVENKTLFALMNL